ncbi:hypothetical protein KSC_028140 [Ktedonobacter sp. SOSP1-52]|uniref:hypothetical protein n=1 Tax=Ktedonobacter sp. SOSP1-52 TaxID=2778366 RepID=UPI00191632CA|nr:hypothetical protein [Ktedonobacter sp. SOSP1-52]GHO63922.1 hypothetical protein KSC_028140 [Ktedonobacter sp. SOSP1-52]
MASSDQRGQRIQGNQYNAGRDIHFDTVNQPADLIAELEKLKEAVQQAKQDGSIDKKKATDVDYQLTKAALEAEETQPNKKTILDHLQTAKSLLEGITAVGGVVNGIVGAIEAVRHIFV